MERVDSKLDPSLLNDRAAGTAAKRRLFWVCAARACITNEAWALATGFVETTDFQRSARISSGEWLSPWKIRGRDSEDSHLNDLGKPQQLGGR